MTQTFKHLDERPGGQWRLRRRVFGQSIVATFDSFDEALAARDDLDRLVREAKLRGVRELGALPWEARELREQLQARSEELARRELPQAPWTTEVTNACLRFIQATKRHKTHQDYQRIVKAWLDWNGGRDKRCDEVFSRLQMEGWHQHTAARLAPTTTHKRVTTINAMWAWASQHDDSWPGVPRHRHYSLPVMRAVPRPSPRLDELDAVLRYIGRDTWVGYSFAFARHTGLRWASQVIKVRWADLRLDRAELLVTGGKGSQEVRTVPLHPDLVELLREYQTLPHYRAPQGDFVFHPEGRSSGYTALNEGLAAATEAGAMRAECWGGDGEANRGARVTHLFRSGFQAALRREGADIDTVKALVGHSRGVHGIYVSPDSLPLREAIERLPAIDWLGPEQS